MDHYFTIESQSQAEFKERGSRFIAFAFPVSHPDEFKKKLKEIKKEHAKATHHCFAYRIGVDGENFRVSDDGEPAGTAGKPILGQLGFKSLTNSAVIVVRYFGGTLLGIPGLINAYKTVAAYCLQLTPVVRKDVVITHSLAFDYTKMNEVMAIVKKSNCTVLHQDMKLFCKLKIGLPKTNYIKILQDFNEIAGLEINTVENIL
ncbi:MAG: YigZ family protein [Ginsengibacter sp.]